MKDIKGMSIEDIMNIDPLELSKLKTKELKQVTSRLVSASNKRLARLAKTEIGKASPAYISAMKRGKKFSVRGKNLDQTRNEYALARNFLRLKTSTTTGWKAVRKNIETNIGYMTKYESKRFWKMYRELEESSGGFLDKTHRSSLSSDRIQKLLHQELSEQGWRTKKDTIINNMQKKIDELYEEEQQSFIDEDFDIDDDDEYDYFE